MQLLEEVDFTLGTTWATSSAASVESVIYIELRKS